MKHLTNFNETKFFQYENFAQEPTATIREHYVMGQGFIDKDSFITYGYYFEGCNKGSEFMEYYHGENYVVDSKAKSYSRMFPKVDEIPLKFRKLWGKLKQFAQKEYPMYWSDTVVDMNTKSGVFESKKDQAADLAAEYVDEFFSAVDAAKFLNNMSSEELPFDEFVEYLDDYYTNATRYFDEAELKSNYYKAIVSAYENDHIEYYNAYVKTYHPWKASAKLVDVNNKTGVFEKFTLNVENYESPFYYQVSKLSNGYRLTFGLSQDQSVAKQKRTSIDLLNIDEKFVDALVATVKNYLKDKPQYSNAVQLKDFILKIYKEKSKTNEAKKPFYSHDGNKYYGNFGAGVIPICTSTHRILLGYRGLEVNEPHTWGIFGGKLDDDEDASMLTEVAVREFFEETRYNGELELIPAYVFKDEKHNFEYHTFIGLVPTEFEPRLNWENERAQWFTFDEILNDLKYDLHFGISKWIKDLRSYYPNI